MKCNGSIRALGAWGDVRFVHSRQEVKNGLLGYGYPLSLSRLRNGFEFRIDRKIKRVVGRAAMHLPVKQDYQGSKP